MFWTAFIWGLGVSCGAAFGLILFVALKCVWDLTVNSKPVKLANELAEAANVALTRRNELTEKQIGQLTSIAASLSTIADASEEMVDSQ